jgi:hypothetical protein
MDESNPQKLADELERETRELERHEEEVEKQIASARETWKSHHETTAPPAPDASDERSGEREPSAEPDGDAHAGD